MSTPRIANHPSVAGRSLLALHAGSLTLAAALTPTAGSAFPILSTVTISGAAVLAASTLPRHRPLLSLGWSVVWTVLGTPIACAELMGVVGEPGMRAVLALGLLCSVSAALCCALMRRARGTEAAGPERTIGHGLLLLAGVLGALLTAEVLLRSLAGGATPYHVVPDAGSPTPLFVKDDVLGLRMTPGFRGCYLHPEFDGQRVEINGHGFRDREWGDAHDAGSAGAHVLLLGDSFVFGLGVEIADTIGRQMERAAGGVDSLMAFAAGVPGHGPPHGARLLDELLEPLDPDVVVMVVFTGNDPADALSLAYGNDDHRHARLDPQATSGRIHVDMLFRRTVSAGYWYHGSRIGRTVLHGFAHHLVRWGLMEPLVNYDEFQLRSSALAPDPEVVAAVSACEDAIARAHDACSARDVPFLLVLAPPIAFVDVAMFDRVFDLRPLNRVLFSPDVLHDRLRSFADRRGIAARDLLPTLRAAHRAGATLYHQEGHWNAAGHHVAAQALLSELVARGWL